MLTAFGGPVTDWASIGRRWESRVIFEAPESPDSDLLTQLPAVGSVGVRGLLAVVAGRPVA